jgi:ectoine hydroxylase-related dioxygenase (phytanoyl-CoA dioxygenase family)
LQKFSVEKFRERGWQVFDDAIPKQTVQKVKDFLQTQVDDQVAEACREMGCPDPSQLVARTGTVTMGGQSSIDNLSKGTRDTLSGHFALQTRLARELWAIPMEQSFQSLVKSILDARRLFLHMPPTARFVLPGNDFAGVPAHQDVSYNKHMSDFVTLWVPLVDIDDECGGVEMYDGSGSVGEMAGGEREQFWLKGVGTGGYTPIHCKLKVGDVLALNKWVIHKSMGNRSKRTRLSIDFRLFGERDRSSKHYLDLQTMQVVPPAQEESK